MPAQRRALELGQELIVILAIGVGLAWRNSCVSGRLAGRIDTIEPRTIDLAVLTARTSERLLRMTADLADKKKFLIQLQPKATLCD